MSAHELIIHRISQVTQLKINNPKAVEIAREFLEQSYTTVIFKNIFKEEDEWIVEFNVGFLNENIKQVRIGVNTGRIVSCS